MKAPLGLPRRTGLFLFGDTPSIVMPGLVPGIHVFKASRSKDVDGRDEARP